MRSHRMRGYGSWCMGWNEAGRGGGGGGDGGGCGMLLVYGFFILLALCFFKVALETGSGLGVLFGVAVLAGLLKGR